MTWDSKHWHDATEKQYEALGYGSGFAMFGVPAKRVDTAKLAIIALNPGNADGDQSWDFDGLAVEDHNWNEGTSGYKRFRKQICKIMDTLGAGRAEVVIGQFIPFRSVNWSLLDSQSSAVCFSRELWSSILSATPARVIICLGQKVEREIADLLKSPSEKDYYDTGWGQVKITRRVCENGRLLIGIPHPSWYGLFTRGARSQVAISSLTAAVTPVLPGRS